ncbi:MAG: GntR family transcriptional regulator [Pseudomonadota bacterium]
MTSGAIEIVSSGQAERSARKGKLHGEATRRLREGIVSGELPPGARLREVQICEELGVSRTPVREAFRTLAAEGLIELLPNRSVVVTELRAADVADLFVVCGHVESLAGDLACRNVAEEELREIGDLLTEMVDEHAKGNRASYLHLNQAIHRRTVEIAANPVLHSVWLSLVPRIQRARAMPLLSRERWSAALLEHTKMFAALTARDGGRLSALTREHFSNSLATIDAHRVQAEGNRSP